MKQQSLRQRIFLWVALLIFVSLSSSAAIFSYVERQPRAQQLAQQVVSVVNLTRAAILSSAPEWREALFAELAAEEGLRISFASDNDQLSPLPDYPPELALMTQLVRERLGATTQFAAERNGIKGLWVSFEIGKDRFWISLPAERMERNFPLFLMVWGGLVLLLSLLAAYFMARLVAAPLKRMAQAAVMIGQGKTPEPLPEQGVREIVTVSHAFNQMSADLAANDRERTLVLAGISHDLRTPLARIRLAAEMSNDNFIRDEIAADVEQMDGVIQQFLDYARLNDSESGELADVTKLVSEVALRFSKQTTTLNVQLDNVPMLYIRAVLLKRALANLIDNAIKYGGGTICVCLQQHDKNIVISVLDQGPGIPAAQLEFVKHPFIRLDTARTNTTEQQKIAGTGLGLAIVDRAARLHHGRFELSNSAQGGLRAELILPLPTSTTT